MEKLPFNAVLMENSPVLLVLLLLMLLKEKRVDKAVWYSGEKRMHKQTSFYNLINFTSTILFASPPCWTLVCRFSADVPIVDPLQ